MSFKENTPALKTRTTKILTAVNSEKNTVHKKRSFATNHITFFSTNQQFKQATTSILSHRIEVTMVRTNNLLLSTLALSTCCVAPTIGFVPETPSNRPSHVRLDLALDDVESASSSVVRIPSEPLLITVVDDDEVNTVASGSNLPPVLQQITDERRNFQVNLGKAMDTLRKDMPYILKETPGK